MKLEKSNLRKEKKFVAFLMLTLAFTKWLLKIAVSMVNSC